MKNNKKCGKVTNSFKMTFPAKSVNEGFARSVVSAFLSQLDPSLEELCDMKTAISEAVTNCIVHAYKDKPCEKKCDVSLCGSITEFGLFTAKIKDSGCGICDIALARTPAYSGAESDERSGMGFTIMECFCDKITVRSTPGKGTVVTLKKYIGGPDENLKL